MNTESVVAVFDLGGTWFRWGLYSAGGGLTGPRRLPAISYLSRPDLCAEDLQQALANFIIERTRQMSDINHLDMRQGVVSVGAPVHAVDQTILGSGPLWGPTAKAFQLLPLLRDAIPDLQWHVLNDITALLAPYMACHDEAGQGAFAKTLLVTVSTGIGSRLFDHVAGRIPFDVVHGVQGEIGHLTLTFELDGRVVNRNCECGGINHLNAFSSGRGIAQILRALPALSPRMAAALPIGPLAAWQEASDERLLQTFSAQLDERNETALMLLDALVTPLSRILIAALSMDPNIDRIVVTGGVVHGFGNHYREALQRTFLRDGLYQISEHDPDYLAGRLYWEESDDFGGLRGAGVYATNISVAQGTMRNRQ